MLRWLYRYLIRAHPLNFRQRFSDELLEIFEEVSGPRAKAWLFADVFLSVVRQWVLRPEFRRPVVMATAENSIFRSLDAYKPRPAALLNGAFISAAILFAVVLAMGHGSEGRRIFLIGVNHTSPHLFPLDRASFAESELNTGVKFAEPADPWRAIASVYFKLIRVLWALDADGDFVISRSEIAGAPAALRKLDINHNGKLTAEECGFSLNADPEFVKWARLQFMTVNPVLAALDSDHDGEISAGEILNSAVALHALDKNGDGSLTPDELIPDKIANQAALILARLHAGGALDADLRNLLENADLNHDGIITLDELTRELRLREERKREFENAMWVIGK
jgi:hypothetical protein